MLLIKRIVLLILFLVLLYSCKKETGHVYLKVIPVVDSSLTNLYVSDANGPVIIDGNFHEVYTRIELTYLLQNKVKYEVIDWNSQMNTPQFQYEDFAISKYLGEFEKLEDDQYYTLNISYIPEKGDPIYYKPLVTIYGTFGGYYFYAFNYIDKSKMIYSVQP